MGILSARHQQHNAIDKFVLVGDYKPVAGHCQQSAEEAAVTDLRCGTSGWKIAATRCSNAFTNRVRKPAATSFTKQDACIRPLPVPEQTFYYREQLESVLPLPHQLEENALPEANLTPGDYIDELLLERREWYSFPARTT